MASRLRRIRMIDTNTLGLPLVSLWERCGRRVSRLQGARLLDMVLYPLTSNAQEAN